MINSKAKVNWKAVFVFYLLACVFSWPYFVWPNGIKEVLESHGLPLQLAHLGMMWGPGLAAIICLIAYRQQHIRRISLSGTSLKRGFVFYLSPFVLLCLLWWINPSGTEISPWHLLSLLPLGFLMIFGEELGWRGFLQDALRPLQPLQRWLLMAVMWEIWHFNRGWSGENLFQDIGVRLLFFVASFLIIVIIGTLTERTKSLFVAISIHSWVNMMWEIPHVNTYISALLSVPIWYFVIRVWPSREKGLTGNTTTTVDDSHTANLTP